MSSRRVGIQYPIYPGYAMIRIEEWNAFMSATAAMHALMRGMSRNPLMMWRDLRAIRAQWARVRTAYRRMVFDGLLD